MMDTIDMDLNTAMYAAIAYVVADLDEMLPRRTLKSVSKKNSPECKGGHYPGDDAPWGVTSLCGSANDVVTSHTSKSFELLISRAGTANQFRLPRDSLSSSVGRWSQIEMSYRKQITRRLI